MKGISITCGLLRRDIRRLIDTSLPLGFAAPARGGLSACATSLRLMEKSANRTARRIVPHFMGFGSFIEERERVKGHIAQSTENRRSKCATLRYIHKKELHQIPFTPGLFTMMTMTQSVLSTPAMRNLGAPLFHAGRAMMVSSAVSHSPTKRSSSSADDGKNAAVPSSGGSTTSRSLGSSSMSSSSSHSLLILGKPGGGKGTISGKILDDFPQFRHVSTGDELRRHVRNGTVLGMEAKKYMDGELRLFWDEGEGKRENERGGGFVRDIISSPPRRIVNK